MIFLAFTDCLYFPYIIAKRLLPPLLLLQYVGDPIECIKRDKEIDTKLIDTYCWIHGTYTKHPPEAGAIEARGQRDHLDFGSCDPQKEDCWHHAYYQFVVMVLVLQAACFYFPW